MNINWRHQKVRFREQEYWLHNNNLSPLHHYSEDGDLLANPFHDISYAVIEDGLIMRFGHEIGKESDLVEVNTGK